MSAIMRFLIPAVVAPFVFAYSQTANSAPDDDVYLRCKGNIAIHKGSGPQIEDRHEIVAHIKSGRIIFSGNDLLSGDNIPICTSSEAQPYFDSETCQGQSRKDRRRKDGTG